jgi:hypothetical protein
MAKPISSHIPAHGAAAGDDEDGGWLEQEIVDFGGGDGPDSAFLDVLYGDSLPDQLAMPIFVDRLAA